MTTQNYSSVSQPSEMQLPIAGAANAGSALSVMTLRQKYEKYYTELKDTFEANSDPFILLQCLGQLQMLVRMETDTIQTEQLKTQLLGQGEYFKQKIEAGLEEYYTNRSKAEATVARQSRASKSKEDKQEGGEAKRSRSGLTVYKRVWRKCGKPYCQKCQGSDQQGQGHGPYWYRYQSLNGHRELKYIGTQLTRNDIKGDEPFEILDLTSGQSVRLTLEDIQPAVVVGQ